MVDFFEGLAFIDFNIGALLTDKKEKEYNYIKMKDAWYKII